MNMYDKNEEEKMEGKEASGKAPKTVMVTLFV